MMLKLIAKLLKPPMRAEQLLGVAQAVQVLDVLLDDILARCCLRHGILTPAVSRESSACPGGV